MHFTKMHGLGNDYVYVDASTQRIADPSSLARTVSDRHTGIGSDGLILVCPSSVADVRMEMYNADGSRAQMCGNGIRCVAKYAIERGLASGPELRIETDAGVKDLSCQMTEGLVTTVRVDMGCPSLTPADLPSNIAVDRIVDHPLTVDDVVFKLTCVSMGNPHAIAFVENLEAATLDVVGPKLETAPEFPERINVHFACVRNQGEVDVRTWERGSGITRACGTGACAVCVAGAITGRTSRFVTTHLPGGDLSVEWAEDDHVYLTGPAVEVFSGEWAE